MNSIQDQRYIMSEKECTQVVALFHDTSIGSANNIEPAKYILGEAHGNTYKHGTCKESCWKQKYVASSSPSPLLLVLLLLLYYNNYKYIINSSIVLHTIDICKCRM